MSNQRWRVLGLLIVALGALLVQAAPAGAVFPPGQGTARPGLPRSGTEMTMSGVGNGQGVTGFIANTDNPFNPATQPYPTANPGTGFTPKNEGFAGIIHGTPTDGSPQLQLYCIDINTITEGGIGYALGTWNAANVPNVGFVGRILTEYFPNTTEPASLTDLNQKAAAVQAAIWFFSDRYVLSTSDSLHAAVAAIVDKVQKAGPLVQPPPPSLTLTPSQASGPAGTAVGPFTVATNAAATITATGGDMFSDAAGTRPIADGATVQNGDQIWVRSTGPSSAVLQATAKAAVPAGNVYLYDGKSPGRNAAQKLILAKAATLTATVQSTAEFVPHGSLVVTKTIAGPAAGQQGSVTIHSVCDGTALTPDLVVTAGTAAGDQSRQYDNIPAGSVCTVTETSDGGNGATTVTVIGNGQNVTIPSGHSATAHITDAYEVAPGSLIVGKTIAGPAAGQQGEVTIHTVCDGTALTPDFVIPAGTPAAFQSKRYDKIHAPATCTVTETADGQTSAVSVVVTGNKQQVSVKPGQIAEAAIGDNYGLRPGQLEVTKSIAGAAAGQQGSVVIHTVCNGVALTPDFVIPAGAPKGVQSQIYTLIATPATCVVTETVNGSTSSVVVDVLGSPGTTTIAPGGAGAVNITDTYGFAAGSLLVRKTIAGPGAGQQGEVSIHTVCDGTALTPDFVIAAGAPAGDRTRRYDNIPAGSGCTVTETADGQTSSVSVVVTGSGQVVSVPAGAVIEADISDNYGLRPGQLEVTKSIAGPAAGQQGEVTIHSECDGKPLTPDLVVPAGAPRGLRAHTYSDIATPASCVVTETADGGTSRVVVDVVGNPGTTTIAPGGAGAVHITDNYRGTEVAGIAASRPALPGSLLVTKTITGPQAGHQGRVVIRVTCNGTTLSPDFVIAAKRRRGQVSRSFDGIPAGSVCAVKEIADGATPKVTVTVADNGRGVPVPGGRVVPVSLMDVYQAAPGFLRVTKTIAGPAARLHGRIAILADCGGRKVFAFRIPARARTRSGSLSRIFADLAAGARCRVTEVAAGSTRSVALVAARRHRRVTIRANGSVTARLIDRFAPPHLVPKFTG